MILPSLPPNCVPPSPVYTVLGVSPKALYTVGKHSTSLSHIFGPFFSFYKSFKLFYFICMSVLLMYICAPRACLVPSEDRRRYQVLTTGVMDGCDPSCGCRELNPDPLQKQQTILITEPSLQPAPPPYFLFWHSLTM